MSITISKTSTDTSVSPGDVFKYIIYVVNNSRVDTPETTVNNIVIRDILPTNPQIVRFTGDVFGSSNVIISGSSTLVWTVGTLHARQSATIIIDAIVGDGPLNAGTSVTNTASLTSDIVAVQTSLTINIYRPESPDPTPTPQPTQTPKPTICPRPNNCIIYNNNKCNGKLDCYTCNKRHNQPHRTNRCKSHHYNNNRCKLDNIYNNRCIRKSDTCNRCDHKLFLFIKSLIEN